MPPIWTDESRDRYDPRKHPYPSDLTGEEWSFIGPLTPPAERGGNKRTVDVREAVNGPECAREWPPAGGQLPAAALTVCWAC
jgi:hypothetical protein